MHTRDDLGDHPDDVGRMFDCRICKGFGVVPRQITLGENADVAEGRYTGYFPYPWKRLQELRNNDP